MVTDQKCWNFTDVMTSVSTKCTFILAEEALVWHNFSDLNYVRGCSSVVERSLCMWKARGSIPRISKLFLDLKSQVAVVAEWLRRWTWNPMGSARVGSNPANCENIFDTCRREPLSKCLLDLNQRPMDFWCRTTTVHRSTNWAIEGSI